MTMVTLEPTATERPCLTREGRPYPGYRVTADGRVISYKSGGRRILKPQIVRGHLQVHLCRNGTPQHVYIHHLVLRAFKGMPESSDLVCDHIDGVPSNNHVTNLRWVTPAENNLSAYRLGLRQPVRKLSVFQVREIRSLQVSEKVNQRKLAARYGVSKSTIQSILSGRRWQNAA